MGNNSAFIAAGVAIATALISLLVSLMNMRNQRKLGALQYKIGYLNEKRKLLESERDFISGLGTKKLEGKLAREDNPTIIAEYAKTLAIELPASFLRIAPYLKGKVSELNDNIKRINSFIASEQAKTLYGESKAIEKFDDLSGGKVIGEIFKINDYYKVILNDEIGLCIEELEKATRY